MKQFIKKLLTEKLLLTEALTDVDMDVNMLYDTYFKSLIELAQSGGILHMKDFKLIKIHTDDLKSPISVAANSSNPCELFINDKRGNFYSPMEHMIGLGYGQLYNSFLWSYLPDNVENLAKKSGNYDSFIVEFTEEKIKGSIHHELAHWIDDTNNKFHITKDIEKLSLNPKKYSWEDRYLSNMEIQAVIHNIYQLKKSINDEIWNTLSFDRMIGLIPTLRNMKSTFKPENYIKWKKLIISRMNREGLLGKNMSSTYE